MDQHGDCTCNGADPAWDYNEVYSKLVEAHNTLAVLTQRVVNEESASAEMDAAIALAVKGAIAHLVDVKEAIGLAIEPGEVA